MSIIKIKKKEGLERVVISLPTSSAALLKAYAKHVGTDNLGEVISEMVKYFATRDKEFKSTLKKGG